MNKVKQELDWICTQVEKNMAIFGEQFPSACTTEGQYRIKPNDDWTNGFWTGMLWICYQYSGKELFRLAAEKNCNSFKQRIDEDFVLDHHDIGFLYTPSLVAQYKITNNQEARLYALKAAEKLLGRYQQKGQFIQAWGQLDDDSEYRFIVDSLINLPLLYWASVETNDPKYRAIADKHYATVMRYGIRDDNSTHHTFYFERATGAPLGGKTAQGFSDNSCWARGQSWVILGSVLNNKYQNMDTNYQIFERVYKKYFNALPKDYIPYWDLIFDQNSNQYHDASTAPIVVTALLERKHQLAISDYDQHINKMVDSLIDKYSSKYNSQSQGLLDYGVYAYHGFKGINESNLWGDYFYLEALYRLYSENEWRGYW